MVGVWDECACEPPTVGHQLTGLQAAGEILKTVVCGRYGSALAVGRVPQRVPAGPLARTRSRAPAKGHAGILPSRCASTCMHMQACVRYSSCTTAHLMRAHMGLTAPGPRTHARRCTLRSGPVRRSVRLPAGHAGSVQHLGGHVLGVLQVGAAGGAL